MKLQRRRVMNPFDLIKALLGNIPANRWIVSVNDVRKGPVTRTHSKLEGTNVSVDFAYEDQGTVHKIQGTIPLVTAGQQGGKDEFTFDGQEVEHDDFLLSSRFVFPGGPQLVVTFKFQLAGQAMRIRFDGRMVG
jgi:hypothetical protein